MHYIRQCFPPVHDAYLTDLNNKDKDEEFGDLCDSRQRHQNESFARSMSMITANKK